MVCIDSSGVLYRVMLPHPTALDATSKGDESILTGCAARDVAVDAGVAALAPLEGVSSVVSVGPDTGLFAVGGVSGRHWVPVGGTGITRTAPAGGLFAGDANGDGVGVGLSSTESTAGEPDRIRSASTLACSRLRGVPAVRARWCF